MDLLPVATIASHAERAAEPGGIYAMFRSPNRLRWPADPFAELRAKGLVDSPIRPRRLEPLKKVKPRGSVSDLVAEQRR